MQGILYILCIDSAPSLRPPSSRSRGSRESDLPGTFQETPPHFSPAVDDAILLRRISAGDTDAVQGLYARYGSLCFGFALRLLRHDRGAAEDVVEAVFVHAWRSAATEDEGSVRPWLLRLTREACVDRLRRREGEPDPLPNRAPARESATGAARPDTVRHVTESSVRAALGELPAEQNLALDLAAFDGLTCEEIARRTGASADTVKRHLGAGLQTLRRAFDSGVNPAR